jgi:hypothetical protein
MARRDPDGKPSKQIPRDRHTTAALEHCAPLRRLESGALLLNRCDCRTRGATRLRLVEGALYPGRPPR